MDDLATNAEKTKIFSADYQKTGRRQAERILDLCATVRALRAVLEECDCNESDTACGRSCSTCEKAKRYFDALK